MKYPLFCSCLAQPLKTPKNIQKQHLTRTICSKIVPEPQKDQFLSMAKLSSKQKERLDQLHKDWPKRHALKPDEVAAVLHGDKAGKLGRGVVHRVREQMKNGTLSGAEVIAGHIHLPLEDLAIILAPSPKATAVIPPSVNTTRAKRVVLTHRVHRIRTGQFWAQVFSSLGFAEDASALKAEIEEIRQQGKDERAAAKAHESKESLNDALQSILNTKDWPEIPVLKT